MKLITSTAFTAILLTAAPIAIAATGAPASTFGSGFELMAGSILLALVGAIKAKKIFNKKK